MRNIFTWFMLAHQYNPIKQVHNYSNVNAVKNCNNVNEAPVIQIPGVETTFLVVNNQYSILKSKWDL